MKQFAQSAAKMGAIGYNTYGNGGFIAYYCLKHQYSTSLRECPICRGIPNGFAGIPYMTMWDLISRLPQTLLQSQMMGYGTGCAFKDKVCEGCRRAYPKNASGQHVWPSGIGGGDFRVCTLNRDSEPSICKSEVLSNGDY